MRILMTAILGICLLQVGAATADGMVDPTKPPAAVMEYLPHGEAQLERPWELSAIQDNGKNGFAVVNGQMVAVGGYYEDFKLTSVKNQKAVFISKLGEKKVVGMGLASVIEPVKPAASIKKAGQPKRLKHQPKKTEK